MGRPLLWVTTALDAGRTVSPPSKWPSSLRRLQKINFRYGCCPDGVTTAKGHNNEGCGCIYAKYGCCPDGKTSAKGSGFYGCPESCAQSQYGCCPDGKTPARGSHNEGCPCQYTRYGCCPDGETTALGPRNDGCDDCRYAKYFFNCIESIVLIIYSFCEIVVPRYFRIDIEKKTLLIVSVDK